MKIVHRVPRQAGEVKLAELDPVYQAEVERALAKAEKAWLKARARLAKAEQQVLATPTVLAIAERDAVRRQVLSRLDELREIQELMRSAEPRGVGHSGRGTVRNPHKGGMGL